MLRLSTEQNKENVKKQNNTFISVENIITYKLSTEPDDDFWSLLEGGIYLDLRTCTWY